MSSSLWDKSRADAQRMLSAMPGDARRRYDRVFAGILDLGERLARNGLPPEAVAEVVEAALTVRRPRARYVIGREAKAHAMLARLLPDRALDALIARAIAAATGRGGRA